MHNLFFHAGLFTASSLRCLLPHPVPGWWLRTLDSLPPFPSSLFPSHHTLFVFPVSNFLFFFPLLSFHPPSCFFPFNLSPTFTLSRWTVCPETEVQSHQWRTGSRSQWHDFNVNFPFYVFFTYVLTLSARLIKLTSHPHTFIFFLFCLLLAYFYSHLLLTSV